MSDKYAFPQHGFTSSPEVLKRMEGKSGMTMRQYYKAAALLKASRQQVWSKEARHNLSVAMLGKKQSLERRKKSSEAHLGKKASPETRARMSEAQKKRRATECDSARAAYLTT